MTSPRIDTLVKAIATYNETAPDGQKINFIHGTTSNALIFMGKTVKKLTEEDDESKSDENEVLVPNALIPNGMLHQDYKLYPITGELSKNTFDLKGEREKALNYKMLSGMRPDQDGIETALAYTYSFKQQEIKENIRRVFSQISLENYVVSLEKLMMYATNLSIFHPEEAKAYAVECERTCEFFWAALLQEDPDNGEEIDRYFNKYVPRIRSVLEECIVPLDGSTFRDQIKNPFPIVVCAASEKLQTKTSAEMLHEGSLELKSVKIIFTPQENQETLREKLASLSIDHIQIETLPPEPKSEAVSTSTHQRFRHYFCEMKAEEKGEEREKDFKELLDNVSEHWSLKFYIAYWLQRKEIIDRRISKYTHYAAGHYKYTQEDLSCYQDKEKILKIHQLLVHIDSLRKPKLERKEEKQTTLISVATTTPIQLGANNMFDFAFFKIEKAMHAQKRNPSVTALEIKDDRLYAVEFMPKSKEHPIVLFSPASDLSLEEEKKHRQKPENQDNTVSIEALLPKLLDLQTQNEKRVFFIPLAESRNRKHWTGLIIQGKNAYFRDPRGEATLRIGKYDLKPLESSLLKRGITLQLSANSFTGYQDFRDQNHCGYFMGAIFEELATSIVTTKKETSSDEAKTTRPDIETLKEEFRTVRGQLDTSQAYKPIKDSAAIQTKRCGYQKLDNDDELHDMDQIEQEDEQESTLNDSEKKSFIQTCKDEYNKLHGWKKTAFWGGVILFGAAIITTAVLTGGIALGLAGAGIALAVSSCTAGVGMGVFTGATFSTDYFKHYYKEASWKKKVVIGITIGLLVLGIGFLTGGLALAGLTGIGIGYAFTTIATSSIVASASIGGSVALAAPVVVATVTGCTTACIQKRVGGLGYFHRDSSSSLDTPEEGRSPTTSTPTSSPTPETSPHNLRLSKNKIK